MQSKRWKARKKISKKQGAVKTHCDHNHHHNHYNRNLHACTSHAIHFSSSATWCYVFSTGMKSNCIHGKQVFQSCNRLARMQVPETDGFVMRAWRGRWGEKNYHTQLHDQQERTQEQKWQNYRQQIISLTFVHHSSNLMHHITSHTPNTSELIHQTTHNTPYIVKIP